MVYRMPRARAGYIVDVQSRLLEDLATRIAIPLIAKGAAPRITLKTLNPLLPFDGTDFILMTQNMASIPVSELGHAAGTLATQRDHIIRAIDALLSGI
jgi:toxin CcdB